MHLNKFEAIGIGLSIMMMAVALWLIRLDTSNSIVQNLTESNQAAVYVADDVNQAGAVTDALTQASDNGVLQRLVIDDVIIGTGAAVTDGDVVTVHYAGTLQNGEEFDNSNKRGKPFTFKVGAGRVIEGWDQGVLGMKVGGQRILVIPAELAYGNRAVGPIPAGSTLVFTIELLEVN